MGPVYPGAGASVGPSFVWGYVAAKHAANVGNSVSLAGVSLSAIICVTSLTAPMASACEKASACL